MTRKFFSLATVSISITWLLLSLGLYISVYGKEENDRDLDLFLLSKVFQKEIEKISGIIELVSNSPEFQVLTYNNVSEQFMNTYHGIPENEEIQKRYIFKNVMTISPSIAGLFFLLPNGDMYVEEPYYYQENLNQNKFLI